MLTLFPDKLIKNYIGGSVMGKQKYTQEEKEEIVKEGEVNGIKEVCMRYEMHISTYYNWRNKLIKNGQKSLPLKSGGHNKGKRIIEEWKIKKVLEEKANNPGYGISQIRNQLRREGTTISTLTIQNVLEDNGWREPKKASSKRASNRFEASRPLELVQIDIMEFYIHKARVYLVFLLDDYSRFILSFSLNEECNIEVILSMVKESIQRYGKFEKLLSDRGFVFHGWKGINRFEKYLEETGIYHIHTSSHHPETIGKVERVNKSVQKELLRVKEFVSIVNAREEVEKWIWNYNYKRVHQGIGGVLVPAERFHGWVKEVEKGISHLVDGVVCINDREISLLNISLVNGKISFGIMGRKVTEENL